MNRLALAAIIEYRRRSLEVCKSLIKNGRTFEAGIIIDELEKNINQALREAIEN